MPNWNPMYGYDELIYDDEIMGYKPNILYCPKCGKMMIILGENAYCPTCGFEEECDVAS